MLTLLFGSLLFSGCGVFKPDADSLAQESGFNRKLVSGDNFSHVVFESQLEAEQIPSLHIYIEGDGTPWEGGRYPAADPTPRRPLAMELMALDPAPALYLGRPCYFGLANSANCDAAMWTSKRYSREVINSMSSVIRSYQREYRVQQLVLIGYSGGGAIAALVAGELTGERFLLTLAANLDTGLWTRQQGFLPLEGSLNPVDQIDKTAHIPQLHLMGETDTTVPNNVTMSYTARLTADAYRVYPGFNHSCCWTDIWGSLLMEQPWARH